jgi:hypothetical protein
VKIAFLHYHLNPGGVTTVLRHQLGALRDDAQLLVISGEAPPPDFPFKVACVPGVGYSSPDRQPQEAAPIAQEIRQAIRRHFGEPCDLLHIHNPLLAKNHLFLDIIQSLQQSGMTLFLQVHDFAEDGRPLACYGDTPYPKDCHYGVINTRDFNNMLLAGLSPGGLHLLPNCIKPFEGTAEVVRESYVLYPVRAIRRKNIGEALLLSLYLPQGQSVFITQPPNSPADVPSYVGWKSFAAAHHLPVRFEMGRQRPFPSLVAAAAWMLTTSISEGFGFAFLDPWTAGKELKGRLLPDICQDFLDHAITLAHLYDGIQVPMEWWGRQHILDRFTDCLVSNRQAYGSLWPRTWEETCLSALQQSSSIDFGMLDEGLQKECLERLCRDPIRRQELLAGNRSLATMLTSDASRTTIARNQDRIASAYHPDRYREQLLRIYARILQRPVRHAIDRRRLLAAFLKPDRFSLLKWGAYHG